MERGTGAPERMGDWTRETPDSEHHSLDTHEVHGLPRVETQDGGLLEKLSQPMAKRVISFLLVAAAAGAYVNWFTGSQQAAEAGTTQIEQKAFEEQKALWLQKMQAEHLAESDINAVLADPELKSVYEEMAQGNFESFDEYLANKTNVDQ